MDRARFLTLAVLAFALILVSFIILGVSRIVLPYRTAQLVAAPVAIIAAALVSYLFVWALLVWLGVRDIADPQE